MENHTAGQETLTLKSCDQNIIVYDNGAIVGTGNGKDDVKVVQECSDDPPKKERFSCSNLSRRNVWTLVLIAMGMFFNGCVFFFMVPFYMHEGISRGVSKTVVGVIFGVLHLAIVICSPIFGHLMPRIGARFMYVSGAFVSGLATMIFSMVGLSSTATSFVVSSLLCRLMTSVGAAAFITAAFAILAHEFPDHTSTVFSITESVHGIGFMVGPVIGGSLFEAAGFIGPFLVVGAMMVWNGVQLYLLLPQPKVIPNTHRDSPFSLLKSSLFNMSMINIFASTLAIQFLDPTLAIRLDQFNLSPALVGLGYLTCPAFYAGVSPLVGYLTDVINIPTFLLLAGTFILCIAFLLLGPCPGLTFLPSELWSVVLATALVGIGFGCTVAPVMKFMITGAVDIGFPHHLDTYGLVSGTFYSLMCGGGIAGNLLGGALLDKYGFGFAAMVVALLLIFTNVITLIYFGYRRLAAERKKM